MTAGPSVPDAAPLQLGLAVAGDLLREGLAALLAGVAQVRVAAVAPTLAALAPTVPLDVIVMDLDAGELPSPTACPVGPGGSPPRVVVLHDGLSAADFATTLETGVSVLVDLNSGADALVDAVLGTTNRSRRRWVRPQLGALPLTTRERAVLTLVALGSTAAEIATELDITVNTVEHHKSRVFQKLAVTNQAQAVAVALRTGQIDGAVLPHDDAAGAAVPAPSAGPVVVVGPATLSVRSIERVLDAAGVRVVPLEGASARSVAVLVEPGADEWTQVERHGMAAVVLRGTEPDGEALFGLVSRGAHAVLPLRCDPAQLVATVQRVLAGDTGLSGPQTRRLVESLRGRAAVAALSTEVTPREREILETLDRGLSVKQAAIELGVSPRTVENTRRVLYRKLGVRNRAEAVASAYNAGVLGDGARSDV
jgi:DNA-binding NarL/FixJ family response regulator